MGMTPRPGWQDGPQVFKQEDAEMSRFERGELRMAYGDNTIAAFTPAAAPYPPYINVKQAGREIEVTVRSKADGEGPAATVGQCAAIRMEVGDFLTLVDQIRAWAAEYRREAETEADPNSALAVGTGKAG